MADQDLGDRAVEAAGSLGQGDRNWAGETGLSFRLRERWLRLRGWLAETFEREVELGRASLWLPVLFGAGILTYFGLPREPSAGALVFASAAAIALTIVNRRRAALFRLWLALAAVIAGTTMMKLRTEMVAAPIVAGDYTGDLTGWVESIERMSTNVRRIVVRVVSLEDMAPEETPFRVRITVRGQFDAVRVGSGISGLVALQSPPAPVMPGGYDFGRELFYEGIGASGFSYGPPDIVDLGPIPLGIRLKIPVANLRASVGARIEEALPGDTGQIANALITGDRQGIPDATTDALRLSGLGHILAISGLHMALVAGAVFGVLRALFALSPSLALRRPIKKWAALGAFGAATFYLVLSGASISTQRSFIMLAVMLIAVLLDRRAFSVRNVAVAATIVLVLTPEALLTASFQMSFAATLALIAGFEVVSERRRKRLAIGPPAERTLLRTAIYWVGGLMLTSILAGLATAPFAAFQFNRTAPLSLLANLAAVPVLSFLVMPMALAAVVLMPFGLEGPPLSIVDIGLRYIVGVAEEVAAWTGNAGLVASAPAAALLLAALGLIWLCLWRQRWRLAGLPILASSVLVAATGLRPDILVEETGGTIAVRGPDGRYHVAGANADFEVETWLRADADPRATNDPSLDEGVTCDPLGCTMLIGDSGLRVALSLEAIGLAEDCRMAAVIITAEDVPADCGAAVVIDRRMLAEGGAQAIYADFTGEGPLTFRVVPTRPAARRPWMPPLVQ